MQVMIKVRDVALRLYAKFRNVALRLYDKFRGSDRGPDQYDFLPSYLELLERPPSPSARITALTLCALVFLSLAWAYLGQLDIHATAEGRMVLSSRSQTIQPYELSEVIEIKVRDGQEVKRGDDLVVLSVLGAKQDLLRFQEQSTLQGLEVARNLALLSGDPLKNLVIQKGTDALVVERNREYLASIWLEHQAKLADVDTEIMSTRTELSSRKVELEVLKKMKANSEKRMVSLRKLTASQAMGHSELLKHEMEVMDCEHKITQQETALKTLQARLDSLAEKRSAYLAQRKREWHEQLEKAILAMANADQELSKALHRSQLQTLSAPVDGVVQQLKTYTIGGVVQPAQELMVIAPHDAPNQAEIFVLNKDIGFVLPGQEVTVKVEAFPYSRYGTVPGKILSVSRDAVKQENAMQMKSPTVFPAQIELERDHIIVDGKLVPLTPGMSIAAEIKIGKRRVIDYLFSPIREYRAEAWREP